VDNVGPEKRVVRVTIFQQPYSLRATGDPAETEAIAHGVDALMNQIADRSSSSDPARVAVLAALHLADKVRALEARAEALEERLGEFRKRLQESVRRAADAEKAIEELERANREDESKSAGIVDQRVAGLYDRLSALDEQLAALLANGSR
jgi:cell division protein ZapA (FtsZ GTPase activity inhibitor)